MSLAKIDSERGRTYDAEQTVFSWLEKPELTKEELVEFYERIQLCGYYQYCNGFTGVKIQFTKRHGAAWFNSLKTVRVGPTAHLAWVACHEMAHALTHATGRVKNGAHGPLFRRHYIELVRYCLSAEKADELEVAFFDARLNVTKRSDIKPRRK